MFGKESESHNASASRKLQGVFPSMVFLDDSPGISIQRHFHLSISPPMLSMLYITGVINLNLQKYSPFEKSSKLHITGRLSWSLSPESHFYTN